MSEMPEVRDLSFHLTQSAASILFWCRMNPCDEIHLNEGI